MATGASDGIPPDPAGAFVDAQVGTQLESRIGGSMSDRAAIAAGTPMGPYLGTDVGESLNASDRIYAENVAPKSLEIAPAGQPSTWRNPETGHSGSFTPTNAATSAAAASSALPFVLSRRKRAARPDEHQDCHDSIDRMVRVVDKSLLRTGSGRV